MKSKFHDRRDAGDLLARHLVHQEVKFDLIVALPRGGVEVALPIARELQIPLDLLIVKKLGAPSRPELAIGAIASGGYAFVNYPLCRTLGISQREITAIRFTATKDLIAREKRLLKDRKAHSWFGKNILIVDDGIATGATMEVAIRAIHAQRPRTISIAVPIAALSAIELLHRRIDHIYALQTPSILGAVGEFYQEFSEVNEETVSMMIDQLERSSHDLTARR